MGETFPGDSAASPAATSVSSGETAAPPSAPADSAASTVASPTTGTPGDGTIPSATTEPGPIPYGRFNEVNERMKTAEQRWQQINERFGDLSQVDPSQYRTAMSLVSQLQSDPVGVVTQMLAELSQHEQYGPSVATQAARVLQGRRGQTVKPAVEEPEPQPDLVAENGEAVYSARQMRAWREWGDRRTQAAIEQRIAEATAPLKEITREREIAKVQQHAQGVANQLYERAQTWPNFKENEKIIGAALSEHRDWTLQDAYIHVLTTKILPALPAQAQAKVVADLQQKAAAQSLNPAGVTRPSTPDFHGDFEKALEHFSR